MLLAEPNFFYQEKESLDDDSIFKEEKKKPKTWVIDLT
jgi:hypothetical protein